LVSFIFLHSLFYFNYSFFPPQGHLCSSPSFYNKNWILVDGIFRIQNMVSWIN
jgi:hypothetical protein